MRNNNNKILSGYLTSRQTFKGGSEVKLISDTLTHSFASISSTPIGVSVTGCINGNDYYQRIGRNIVIKNFHLSGILQGGQTGTGFDDQFNVLRICLVERAVGSTQAVDLNTILDPRILGGLVRVLYDRVFTLESPNPLATGYMAAVMPVEIDVRTNFTQRFSGTTVATQSGTELALYMVSDSSAVVHPGFTSGQWVSAFSDL